jgi:hypothetical protein
MNAITHGIHDLTRCEAAIRGLASLFYPTERSEQGHHRKASAELYYYAQREWRVISDIVLADDDKGAIAADIVLTRTEADLIAKLNPDFFLAPFDSSRTVIERCSILRDIDSRSISQIVSAVYVEKRAEATVTPILSEFRCLDKLKLYEAEKVWGNVD